MMRVCPRIESFIRILVRQERGCEAGLKGDQVSHSFKKNFFLFFFIFLKNKNPPPPPVPKVVTDRTPIPVVTTNVVNVYPYIPVILMYTSCIPVPHTGTHVLRKLKKINIRFSSHAPLIFSTIPCKGWFFSQWKSKIPHLSSYGAAKVDMTVKIIPHPEEGGTAAHIDVALIHWKKGRGHEIRKNDQQKRYHLNPPPPLSIWKGFTGTRKHVLKKPKKF